MSRATISDARDPRGPLIVFCGPTISAADARAIATDALCLAPARCGDVLLALRLQPRAVLLIDGVFERSGSVWHKELLLACERGVPMFGAASMGALRAAELDSLGMVGIGEVYRRYATGELADDDEVAVVHTPSGEARSDAMVDLRATVALGRDEGVLSAQLARALLDAAKALFYPERTLEAAAAALDPSDELSRFVPWARRRWVSLKRRDADEALRMLARRSGDDAPARGQAAPLTGNLRELYRHISLTPFPRADPALPARERIAQAARFVGGAYDEAKRLGRLLATVADLAGERVDDVTAALALLDRFEAKVMTQLAPSERALFALSRYERWIAALGDASTAARRRLTARLLRAVDRAGRLQQITPRPSELVELLADLRSRRGLATADAVRHWRSEHGLDSDAELGALLLCCYRERALAHGAVLAPPIISPTFWLWVGLQASGVDDEARQLLSGQREPALPSSLDEALALDFDDEHDARIEAHRLTALSA